MKKKKLVIAITSVALLAAVAVGGTFAYLTAKPAKKTNTFTMGAALTGELKEVTWDNDPFTDETSNIPEAELGKTLAQNFVPGRVIPKDPTVKNTSTGTNAYVAVKISYTNDDDQYAQSAADIMKFADINWNENWTFNDDHTIAYYNFIVDAGDPTEPLFTNVTIKEDATDTDMKNFNIEIEAYLVQAEGFDNAEAALTAAFPNEFAPMPETTQATE